MESIIIIIIIIIIINNIIIKLLHCFWHKQTRFFLLHMNPHVHPLTAVFFFWESYWTLTLIRMILTPFYQKRENLLQNIYANKYAHNIMCMTIVAITLQLQFIFVLQN